MCRREIVVEGKALDASKRHHSWTTFIFTDSPNSHITTNSICAARFASPLVIPAKAGDPVTLAMQKGSLDSGFRRNDEQKKGTRDSSGVVGLPRRTLVPIGGGKDSVGHA